MKDKKEVKESEAKILIYLSVVHPTRRYVTAIANKLLIDYSYIMRILQGMTAKGWLRKHQYRRKMFYSITEFAPLETAKNVVLSDTIQLDLENSNYTQEELITKVPVIRDEVKNEE